MTDRHARLRAAHAGHKARLRSGAPAATVPLPLVQPDRAAPCPHRSAAPVGETTCRTCKGRVALKVYGCAVHGACTVARRADGVRGVCEGCPDHPAAKPAAAKAPAPARRGWLTVPQPPALDLKPTRDRALVTVVVGAEAKACYAASGSLMRAYADRVGADLVVLDWPGHPAWPMSSKFAIARVLDHYERMAYVDADVLLRPGCVDLFEQCGAEEMGICDELPWHRRNPRFGREASYQRFRADMGFRSVPRLAWYGNAGVMVVPRSHRELLLPPAGPMPVGHCAEQDHTNAKLLDSGMKYKLLPRECNYQNWTDPGFRSAPPAAVLHWSGAGGARRDRAGDMARAAAAARKVS